MICAPSEDSDQPRHPLRLFAVCMKTSSGRQLPIKRMTRLIWTFGHFVDLSCCGSNKFGRGLIKSTNWSVTTALTSHRKETSIFKSCIVTTERTENSSYCSNDALTFECECALDFWYISFSAWCRGLSFFWAFYNLETCFFLMSKLFSENNGKILGVSVWT